MAKRRPNGDGLVRKRDDGRWEGRIVVGHKNDGSPITDMFLQTHKRNCLKNYTVTSKLIVTRS